MSLGIRFCWPRFFVFYDCFLKRFKVLLDIRPLEVVTGFSQTTIQLFSEYQGQEAAKDMAPYGLIALMENGHALPAKAPCI
jgi:hypothetical protein